MSTTTQHGRIHRWRARWFGERDAVDKQIDEVAREGGRMAKIAHGVSFILIILFSAGSLAALGADALHALQVQWLAGVVDIPSAISLSVSTLMVAAMDVGMVYAAMMLRLLSSRRAGWREKALHIAVMLVVAVLEAGTYCYMSYRFEAPATQIAGIIIVARACAAPLLSVYLSLARALPVTSRDIMYQVELAQGKGLVRDMVTAANDPTASLGAKLALYDAAAIMTQPDRERLRAMIGVVERRGASVSYVDAEPPRFPTGGGTPSARGNGRSKGWHLQGGSGSDAEAFVEDILNHGTAPTPPRRTAVLQLTPSTRRRTAAQKRASTAKARRVRTGEPATASYEEEARRAWAEGARSVPKMQRATGMSKAAAMGWVRTLKAEGGTYPSVTQESIAQ